MKNLRTAPSTRTATVSVFAAIVFLLLVCPSARADVRFANIFSGNINWQNFLNYTLLSIPKEEYVPTVEELCGDYLEKWGKS